MGEPEELPQRRWSRYAAGRPPYCKLNIPAETGWKVKECGEIHRLDIKPMTCIWILSVAAAIAGCNSPNIIANFFRSAMTFTAR